MSWPKLSSKEYDAISLIHLLSYSHHGSCLVGQWLQRLSDFTNFVQHVECGKQKRSSRLCPKFMLRWLRFGTYRRFVRRRKMPAFRSAKTNVHAPLFTSRKALRNVVAINRIRNGVKHGGFRRDGLLARELDKMKLV